jgi:hypothetical protein
MFNFFTNLIKARQEWLTKTNTLPPTYKYLQGKNPNLNPKK